MAPSQSPAGDLLRLVVRHPLRWLVPAVVVGAAACGYAVWKRNAWEASQAMMVRAEAGGEAGVGRFRDLSEMKTLQETIQEVAKSRTVLTTALVEVGPGRQSKTDPARWPAPQDVDDLAETLKIAPPKGTEFGSTEVFYLKVRDPSAERSARLAEAIGDQLVDRFREIRQERAKSMVAELDTAVELARDELNEAVARLKAIESQVGSDLGELRNLDKQGSGEGDVRRLVVELESEIRQNEQAERTQHELLEMLAAAKDDPSKLPAMPNRLLESQPALKRLKDGLIDAQLRTSQLKGNMSVEHPAVKAAAHAEEEIRSDVRGELSNAVLGVQAELEVIADVLADRRQRLDNAKGRLDRLASLRAEYSAVNGEVEYRLRQLETAERKRVEARASQAGGVAASLLTKIGRPDVGTKPVGPGRTLIAASGLAGGLLFGLGCLLLTTTTAPGVRPAAEEVAGEAPSPGGADGGAGAAPAEVLPIEERVVEEWKGAGRTPPSHGAPHPAARPIDVATANHPQPA